MNDFIFNLSRVLAHSMVYEKRREIFYGAVLKAFNPQNIGVSVGAAVAIGAVAAGAIGAGATAYAASSASSSASQATAANAANINNTNQLNYQLFEQGRGSLGSAIYPIYAQGGEAALYGDTLNTYNATGALQPTAAQYQAIVANAAPAVAGANATTAGIFNGNTENQELGNLAPVNQANLTAVATQKQGTLEALQSTLNNIKAIQAGKGYNGDSFGTQLLNFSARQNANTTASNALSQAQITNAQNTNTVKQNAINRQIQNVNLPYSMAANNANLASLPANALESNMAQRQQLFNNFRIGTGQFQYQNLPTVNPVASTGQIAGQAAGTAVGSVGNFLTNKSLISTLNNGNTNGGTPTALSPGVAYPSESPVTSENVIDGTQDEEAALAAGGIP